jgi:ribosomal protein S18 acetylase RimI-like enzyme
MEIRRLGFNERPPIDLLLLADPSQEKVCKYLARGECYVAEIKRQIMGTYVLLPTRPETTELVNVAIAEAYQGQGYGRQLICHAIDTAKRQGFRTIEVGTGNSSILQLVLYQKCGFRIIGVDINFFVRNYAEIIMENGLQCKDMIRLSQEL